MTFYTYGELAARRPTGRRRHRVGWRSKLILQVEIKSPKPRYPAPPEQPGQPYDPWSAGSYTFWRDAEPADVLPVDVIV